MVDNPIKIVLYSNKHLKLNHGECKEKIPCIRHSMCNGDNSLHLQRNHRNLPNAIATDAISSTFRESSISHRRGNSRYPISPFSYRHFVHTFFLRPKIRIENLRIETRATGSQTEFKDAYFDIHNHGREGVDNAKAKVRIDGLFGDLETLNLDFPHTVETFSLNPDEKLPVKLCQLTKTGQATTIPTIESLSHVLGKGRAWKLEIQFFGKNFLDRKVWKLQLDLTSYEAFSLELLS